MTFPYLPASSHPHTASHPHNLSHPFATLHSPNAALNPYTTYRYDASPDAALYPSASPTPDAWPEFNVHHHTPISHRCKAVVPPHSGPTYHRHQTMYHRPTSSSYWRHICYPVLHCLPFTLRSHPLQTPHLCWRPYTRPMPHTGPAPISRGAEN